MKRGSPEMKLRTKMILLIVSLIVIVMISLAYFFQQMLSLTIKEQIGSRALAVAETVALIPEIREAFSDKDPSKRIQPIVEEIRKKTGAQFIVVGNTEGIRYAHPVPTRIGKEMVGGDNGPVLQGKSIISEAVGTLGPSLRGKTPIFDDQGKVIGVVSVGFLIEDINAINVQYQNKIIFLVLPIILVGIFGTTLITNRLKKAILGLEPKQIVSLYQEKKAILESIREGIIAINANGMVTMANYTAVQILGMPLGTDITGKNIYEVLPISRLLEVVQNGQSEFDQEMRIGENEVVVNRIPIFDQRNQVIGAVASFRNKSELYRLSQELSQVKRYTEALRAQTHEYSNKLHMISGLIQLEHYQEAIETIQQEANVHQNFIHFIMKEIPDPLIGGLLIGKFNWARELKVELELVQDSSFRDVPKHLDRSQLVTILGNLIDNAVEAVLATEQEEKKVKLFFTDISDDLIIEVEDNGHGIPDSLGTKIFEVGFSTKAKTSRGFGLSLARQAIGQLNGYITFESSPEGGTIFTVVIPKDTKK